MSRVVKSGKLKWNRQLQRCAESGTSRICIPLAFQSLTAAVRGVPLLETVIPLFCNAVNVG